MKPLIFFFLFSISLLSFSQDAPKDTCTVSLPNSYSVNANTAITGIQLIFNCPVSELSVKVYNRWGNVVHEEQVENGTSLLKWDPSELPSGTYFYILNCKQLSNFNWLGRNISSHITLITNKK